MSWSEIGWYLSGYISGVGSVAIGVIGAWLTARKEHRGEPPEANDGGWKEGGS